MNHSVISYSEACAFVKLHHRHHLPPQGHKYSIAAFKNNTLVGVVMVGRPVSRIEDNGKTLEITRLCTLEGKNINSFLLGKAAAACRELGFEKIITYTLTTESQVSLTAAAFQKVGELQGRLWREGGYDGRGVNRTKWQRAFKK